MQLCFDWARRERCALRTMTCLEEIDVPGMQRAVVRLMIEHEDAEVIDADEKIVTLRISYRAALRWMRTNLKEYREFEGHASSFYRALAAWKRRGIIQTFGRGPTTIAAHFGRLAEWHATEEMRLQEAIRAWASVASCSKVLPAVPKCCPIKERKKEDPSFFLSEEKASGVPNLPPLPEIVFDAACTAARLREGLLVWWNDNDLPAAGFVAEDVVGALLAARAASARDPDSYVAGCLRRGVGRGWQAKAQALIKGPETRPYAPHGTGE